MCGLLLFGEQSWTQLLDFKFMTTGNQRAKLPSVCQGGVCMMWEKEQEASMMFVLSLPVPAVSSGDSSLLAFKCIQSSSLSLK